jgi:hypothetical protein
MAHKIFTSTPPDRETEEPISFDIVGTYSDEHPEHPGEEWSESFSLIAEMPVGVLALYQRVAASDKNGGTAFSPSATISFLAAVIDENVEQGRSRFYVLCDDPDRIVRLELLTEILKWAAEELTDRPTGPAST